MKVILLTTLLLFSINGFAFNWKKVGEDVEGNSFYVDVDNIKNHKGLVYYWQLNDYLEPFKFSVVNASSDISKYKVNCGEEKLIWLNVTYYSQSMGRGSIIEETSFPKNIQYPKPKSVEYNLMKSVCDYVK